MNMKQTVPSTDFLQFKKRNFDSWTTEFYRMLCKEIAQLDAANSMPPTRRQATG